MIKTFITYVMILTIEALLVYTLIAVLSQIFNPKDWILMYKFHWISQTSTLFIISIVLLEQYKIVEKLKK